MLARILHLFGALSIDALARDCSKFGEGAAIVRQIGARTYVRPY
jgi:hypothetical protein